MRKIFRTKSSSYSNHLYACIGTSAAAIVQIFLFKVDLVGETGVNRPFVKKDVAAPKSCNSNSAASCNGGNEIILSTVQLNSAQTVADLSFQQSLLLCFTHANLYKEYADYFL